MNNILFIYFHSLSANTFIAHTAVFLHQYTNGILFVILIISLLLAKRRFFAFSLLVLSGLLAWVGAEILKSVFHTARPFIELGFTPLVYQDGFSFPSQHAAIFSALAISMYLVHKPFASILSVFAILVGISRIILGVHYPIDIVGGFCLGFLVSFLLIKVFRKI